MKKKVLSLILVAAMGVSMLVGCGGTGTEDSQSESESKNSEAGSEDKDGEFVVKQDAIDNLIASSEGKTVHLDVWCSETTAYQEVMGEVIEAFKAQYPDVSFEIVIGAQSEAGCKDRVLEDPEAAADVFVFADDQINDLVKAGALQEVVTTYTYDPAVTNDEATVEATKVNGKMYAYPLTASNGYFLYYDSRYVSAEDVKSWETLLAAAEKAGKKVGMNIGDGWYIYSFFAGADLELTMNADGSNSCNWNNETGLKVANKIKEIASNSAFISINNTDATARMKASGDLVAYVDGTWDATPISEAYGEGYSATKLPTYNLDGEDVQMGSYAGYKFVGVNSYSQEKGWAMLLAEYITNEENQSKIGVATTEMPANTEAAKAPELQNNVALKGLSEQYPFSDRQVVGGKYWDPAASLGAGLADGSITDIQQALNDAVLGITQPAN